MTIVPLIETVGFPDCVVTTVTTPGSTALVLLPLNGFFLVQLFLP
jgi:hypothetical protein